MYPPPDTVERKSICRRKFRSANPCNTPRLKVALRIPRPEKATPIRSSLIGRCWRRLREASISSSSAWRTVSKKPTARSLLVKNPMFHPCGQRYVLTASQPQGKEWLLADLLLERETLAQSCVKSSRILAGLRKN